MMTHTHIRVKHCIQDINTREIQHFKSINKAKKHSLENFHNGKLRKADKLFPALDEES